MNTIEFYDYTTKSPTGVTFPCRSFLIRENDKLVVISPANFDSQKIQEIKSFDPSIDFISPNNFHNVNIGKMKNLFPNANFFGPKRSAKQSNIELRPIKEFESESITSIKIDGHKMMSETAFFHIPSKTMIVADLFFNVRKQLDFISNIVLAITGTKSKMGISNLIKISRSNKELFKQSAYSLLDYPFERIAPAHGEIATKEEFKEMLERCL